MSDLYWILSCINLFLTIQSYLFRYMHYFHTFGFIEETWYMALSFLVVSVAAALVESHPISTELDDNLTVPLTSFLVGSLIF
jgi:farnesol kinase